MVKDNKQKHNLFLGFEPDEIVNLYKFLSAYEKIESYRQDESFKRAYPKLYESLFEVLKSLDLKAENGISIIQDVNKVRYTNAKRNKHLAFLYHLRNSVAHGYIRKGEVIEIKDLLNRELTASGNIDNEKFARIINVMNLELLNDF